MEHPKTRLLFQMQLKLKAVLLAGLERSLNERQEAILLKARQEIDLNPLSQ